MREIEVFGRRLLADRQNGRWVIFDAAGEGKRRHAGDLLVPEFVASEGDLAQYLADMLHELATPTNSEVRWIT